MPDKIVEAYNLVKSFNGIKAVNGVSFSVNRGEIFGILGPNGAGKTTTIRMTIGVLTPDEGRAYIMGYDVHKNPVRARSFIGVVPEISNPYLDLSVWDNLILAGRLYHIPRRILIERAINLLKTLEIYSVRDRKAKALSKGLRRRLLLAMALISDPDILFLDEPTSGLDVISARIIKSLLLKLKEIGKTIILTTHNINEAGMLCDRIAVMKKGEIIALGTPEELKIKLGEYIRILLCFNKEVDFKLVKECLKEFDTLIQGRRMMLICKMNDLKTVLDRINTIIKMFNLDLEGFQVSEPTLEDVFIELISR